MAAVTSSRLAVAAYTRQQLLLPLYTEPQVSSGGCSTDVPTRRYNFTLTLTRS